jgi:TonB family protein
MFQLLLESSAGPTRRRGWTAASAGAHATLVAVAAVLTVREALPPPARVRPETVIYTVPPREKAPAAPQRENAPRVPDWRAPSEITVSVPHVPVISFPGEVPLTIGPIDTVHGGLPPLGVSLPGPANRIYSETSVEKPAVPRPDNPSPDYPISLRAAQVEGEALVQFVVDKSGRVEPGSIAIVQATHPLFAESVRRWLARTRYAPAEVNGAPVRQLVQQQVAFTLRP